MAIKKKAGRPKGAKNKTTNKATNKTTAKPAKIVMLGKAVEALVSKAASSVEVKEIGKNSATGRDAKGNFLPGNKCSPMPGFKHRKSIFLDAIGEDEAAFILREFLDKIKAGNVECLLFAAKRLYPESGQKNFLKLNMNKNRHDLNTIDGINNAGKDIVGEVIDSEVAIEDGQQMMNLLKSKKELCLDEVAEQIKVFMDNRKKVE